MGSCCDKEPEMLHALQKKHGKVLWVVLAINLIMFAAELITGYLAGSTAVLADSLDMLGDSLVYGFGIFALGRSQVWQVRVSRMKGLIMFGFGCAVIVQAIYKFAQISIPDAELMGWIGLLALTMNAICFGLLWGHRSDNINIQSTWICSRNDLIANVGVLIAAGLTSVTVSKWPDLIVGLLIAGVFLRSAVFVLSMAGQCSDSPPANAAVSADGPSCTESSTLSSASSKQINSIGENLRGVN